MILSQEQRDRLAVEVNECDLRPEARERILALLAKEELTPEETGEIQDLIQADVEADIASVPGLAEDIKEDVAYQALVEETEQEIAAIEKDLAESMEFVESEGAKLDASTAELEQVMTDIRVDQIKENLAQ